MHILLAQCPTNLVIRNGFVIVSQDNKLAAYGCYSGYRVVGNNTAECLPDGSWNSEPPICVGMLISNLAQHVPYSLHLVHM